MKMYDFCKLLMSSFDFYFPSILSSNELSFEEESYSRRFKKYFSLPGSFFSSEDSCIENIILDDVSRYEIEIFIDDIYISKIIGRRGENINKIRNDCKVYVCIYDKNEENITKRKIKIAGRKKDVILAKENIMEYVFLKK